MYSRSGDFTENMGVYGGEGTAEFYIYEREYVV